MGRISLMPNLLVWCLVAVCCMGASWATVAHADPAEDAARRYEDRRRSIAQHMEQATVLILVFNDDELQGVGSGFVVADGHVMTNAHVVDAGSEWYILREGLKATKARLVKRSYSEDPGEADFALLRFTPSSPIQPLSFNTQVGRMDRVSAWGFPYMVTKFDQSMDSISEGDLSVVPAVVYTEGVVSTLVRSGKARNIIHTAAIAGGNSGGPLINNWGEVVGINSWGSVEEDEGAFINAALPADKIVAFLESCGVEPLMSQRSTSPLSVAMTPPDEAPAPVSADKPAAPSGGVAPSGKGGTGDAAVSQTPPQGLSPEMVEVWRSAVAGDVESQTRLAYAFYNGKEAPKDIGKAEFWIKNGVAQHKANAVYLLGAIRVLCDGYKNVAEGMKLLRSAADVDPDYASLLAMLLFKGEHLGVERQLDDCFHYATLGAKTGDADAKAILGMMYFFGEGNVEEDPAKALQLAREAEMEENPLGLALLGWMYYIGGVVPENGARALSYATDAAERGEGFGMALLAVMYYQGDGVKKDDVTAGAWARRAADEHNEFGYFVLGMLAVDENDPKKRVEAWANLDMAAAKNVADAEENRDDLAKSMSREQLQEAQKLRDSWSVSPQ